jgi:hypothetical protein
MGSWPRPTYVQYVDTHAQARDIVPPQFLYDAELFSRDRGHLSLLPTSTPEAWGTR